MGAGKHKNVPGVACSVDGGKTVVIDILLCWSSRLTGSMNQVNLKHTGQEHYKLRDYKISHCKVLFYQSRLKLKVTPEEEFFRSYPPFCLDFLSYQPPPPPPARISSLPSVGGRGGCIFSGITH